MPNRTLRLCDSICKNEGCKAGEGNGAGKRRVNEGGIRAGEKPDRGAQECQYDIGDQKKTAVAFSAVSFPNSNCQETEKNARDHGLAKNHGVRAS